MEKFGDSLHNIRKQAIDRVNRSVKILIESNFAICPVNSDYWYAMATHQRFRRGTQTNFHEMSRFPQSYNYFVCYKNAADCGNIHACYDLARLYLEGDWRVFKAPDIDLAEYYCDKGLSLNPITQDDEKCIEWTRYLKEITIPGVRARLLEERLDF